MASENENEKRETLADIVADIRERAYNATRHGERTTDNYAVSELLKSIAARIEAAWKQERELLRSCARWILTHDIYGHMAQELLAECKKVLGNDGKFLMPKGDTV